MIGDRIKRIRLFKNMTQEELVDGIASIAYLSKVENGQSVPSSQFVLKIADKLGLEADFLLSPAQSPADEEEVARIFENYWKRKILSERDISLIRLYCGEMQTNRVLLMAFSVLIRYFYSDSRLTEAKDAYILSKKLVKLDDASPQDSEAMFYYLFSCGVLHFELYEYEIANHYFLRAESCMPDDPRQKARVYYNLSLVNEKFNSDKSLCLYYSGKACSYMKKTGDNNRVVNILLVRSIQFYSMNLPDRAMECIREAENLLSLTSNDTRLKSSIIFSYGSIHQKKKDYKKAIEYFLDYIALVEQAFPEKVTKGYKHLVEIHIELREWDQAAKYLDQAKAIASQYKKVFFDKEIKLLEISIHKIQQADEKYEKEMQKLLALCEELGDYTLGCHLAAELGAHFFAKRAYKKSAAYYNQAYELEKQLKKSGSSRIPMETLA